jgi:N6-L-threonylcarbamoyladenine synthase
MSNGCFIGIDTSNYTTSAAICTEDGTVVANIKKMLPVKAGERGLRQSDAVFAHIKNMPEVMAALGDKLRELDLEVSAIGYSASPRDADGSYMPCFLVGCANASSQSAVLGVQSFPFSHQAGHVRAAAYSSGFDTYSGEFAAFHISGGTTELLICKRDGERLDISLVGGTLDLNAGQAIDRIGVLMGLSFPCGREMEALARGCDADVPSARVSVSGLECNLSGLENKAKELYSSTGDRSLVCAFVFDYLARVIGAISSNLRKEYPDIPILYSGGVMSNKIIHKKLSRIGGVYFAEPEFSADNAAGVALLCREKYFEKKF